MIKPIQAANIAKAIFYIKNATLYLDYVMKSGDAKHDSKHILGLQIRRLENVIETFRDMLQPETRKALDNELAGDTMVFEALYNVSVLLDEKRRYELEEYANKLLDKQLNENA